jgi:hypothetical protein
MDDSWDKLPSPPEDEGGEYHLRNCIMDISWLK